MSDEVVSDQIYGQNKMGRLVLIHIVITIAETVGSHLQEQYQDSVELADENNGQDLHFLYLVSLHLLLSPSYLFSHFFTSYLDILTQYGDVRFRIL